jgi:hypothetical protein
MEHKHTATTLIMPMSMFIRTYRMLIMAPDKLSLSSACIQAMFTKTEV